MIHTHGCAITDVQRRAIEQGMAHAPATAAVHVIADFEGEVRRRLGHDGYSTDRGVGEVAGKTIGNEVLLNATAILHRLTPSDLRRLVAHEAGHVNINTRSEGFEFDDWRQRPDWQPYLLGNGGIALEEFRIERQLLIDGYPVAETVDVEHIDTALAHLNAACVETVVSEEASDVRWMIGNAMTALGRLLPLLGYVAAAWVERPGSICLDELDRWGRANWDEYVAPTWDRRLDHYRTLPSSSVPIGRTAALAATSSSLELEHDLTRSLGFEFRSVGQDWGFYRLGADSQWEGRVRRFEEQLDAGKSRR